MSEQHIGIVLNPSKVEAEVLEDALDAASEMRSRPQLSIFETTPEDPGGAAAAQALAAGVDLIITAGGDGTVRAVAEVLAQRRSRVELGIVPLGTGNLLARNLGIPLGDVDAALARALDGTARPVDVGWCLAELEDGPRRSAFLVMAGVGVDARMIDETDDDLKKTAGWIAYVEAMGRAVTASSAVEADLVVDGETRIHETVHTVLVGNVGTVQGGIDLLPDAAPDDGRLDLLILGEDGVAGWADTVGNVVWDNGIAKLLPGRGDGDGAVDSETATRLALSTLALDLSAPRMAQIDGEALGETTSLRIEVQPAALRIRL
ncbi:diacylglycerol/lipid kinase family protein [Brachybacterium phenoliresistens]|uniref:diacylglycerol/lipid kinase family protein n=1 Tax=Brachybacterium phenoliresistens TaxID=396014 RepID=UPI0031D07ABD